MAISFMQPLSLNQRISLQAHKNQVIESEIMCIRLPFSHISISQKSTILCRHISTPSIAIPCDQLSESVPPE